MKKLDIWLEILRVLTVFHANRRDAMNADAKLLTRTEVTAAASPRRRERTVILSLIELVDQRDSISNI